MKIEHIALYVNDLQKTRSFFMKYLGAKSNEGYHNLQTNFRSYFLSFDISLGGYPVNEHSGNISN